MAMNLPDFSRVSIRPVIYYLNTAFVSVALAYAVQYYLLPAVPTFSTDLLKVKFDNIDVNIEKPSYILEKTSGTLSILVTSRGPQNNRDSALRIEFQPSNSEIRISPEHLDISLSQTPDVGTVTVTCNDTGTQVVRLGLSILDTTGSLRRVAEPKIDFIVVPTWSHRLRVSLQAFIVFFSFAFFIRQYVSFRREQVNRIEQKVVQAESKAQAEPEKSKYAWDAARINLEAYFERNRLQVAQVFVIAVIVMSIGFILVCFGVYLAMTRTETIKPALVAGVSGIITQFIGATFMVIYRSTMTQANEFMVILERINTVGMAIQVLGLIPESETTLKNESRAKIVELLLSANISTAKAKTTKSKSPNG